MVLVLDASVTIAWLFEDEETDLSRNAQALVEAEGAVVPSLWRLEVANALRTAVCRGRCDDDYVNRSLGNLSRLVIAVDPETDAQAWGRTLELSRTEMLTLYDAAYLELAQRRGLLLASGDAALLAAAARLRIPTI